MVKTLTAEQKKELLSYSREDFTFNKVNELCGRRSKRENGKMIVQEPYMAGWTEFVLEPKESFNKTKVVTTVGEYIINKLVVEENLQDVLGYINEEINGDTLGKLDDMVTNATLLDKITAEKMAVYLEDVQFIGMRFHNIFSGSFTMASLKPNKKIIAERDRLIKLHKEAIENGDAIVGAQIESTLVKMAENELKGDPGMDLFYAKARGSFGNNYKNTSIMRGTIPNPITGGFDVTSSNFMEGIRKEEMHMFGNSVIMAAYPKAIGTATSGYFSKQLMASQQAITSDAIGSDCGSKRYIEVEITKGSMKDYIYRFIIESGKIICLDDDTISKYLGKVVKMRSVMYCATPNGKICYHCTGKLFYLLNVRNTGLTSARVASTQLNLSMKKFHDASIKLFTIELKNLMLKETFDSGVLESSLFDEYDPSEDRDKSEEQLIKELMDECGREDEIVLEGIGTYPAKSAYGFFHASPYQNLGEITANETGAYPTLGAVIFASQSKSFAACFAGEWDESEATIDVIHSRKDDKYSIEDVQQIVFSYDPRFVNVEKPASLYRIAGKFSHLEYPGDIEVIKKGSAKVLHETKYESWKKLMEENGVKLVPMTF